MARLHERFHPLWAAVAAIALTAGLALPGCDSGSDAPQSPTDPDGGGDLVAAVFGAVGCSQTRDVVQGYHRVGAGYFWPAETFLDYGGATIDQWSNPGNRHWDLFQNGVDSFGVDGVWFQVCVLERFDPNPTATDLMQAEAIVDEIRRRAPGVTIYVSPLNDYRGVICSTSGPEGPEVATAIADHLMMLGMAQAGPIVGPLSRDTTVGDNCHANNAGKLLQGEQLAAFFDVR